MAEFEPGTYFGPFVKVESLSYSVSADVVSQWFNLQETNMLEQRKTYLASATFVFDLDTHQALSSKFANMILETPTRT